jgi:hypothetical protein
MNSFLWIALFGALVGALLFYWITKFILKFRLKRRFDRASEGEFEAQNLLAEHGYQIEQIQKTAKLSMWINGELFSYLVRPDAFATKENLKFLVEIKTGKIATNPKNTSTRRQLLEYFHGFQVDGILLVDADLRKIHRIHFDLKSLEIESKKVEDPLEKLKIRTKILLT